MDYLAKNLMLLKDTTGWSYDTITDKFKKGMLTDQQFSRDQIIGFSKGRTPPTIAQFKIVFAKFMGLPVEDVSEKELTAEQIQERISRVDDAGEIMLANQIEIIANQRVILSLLASIKKPAKSSISNDVRSILQTMVEEEKDKVLKEKRQRY